MTTRDTPTPLELVANPVGSSASYVTGRIASAGERLAGFASDRLIDIGGTLLLASLGVALAVVGVLRIFAAGANTQTGSTLIGLSPLGRARTK